MATPDQVRRRGRWSLVLGTFVVAAALAAVAYADDIPNNLDASVDAVAEAMPLTVGGSNGTTQLYVVPRNGDGKNGCNLTGGTTLVVGVSSSNTSVATVTPSSVTFTSCGNTPTLTVTPHNAGSATISLSQTSNNTGATFNLATATFTVTVSPPPNTAPSVSVSGVTGGASYDKGTVPAATCEVTDTEDGNSSSPATLGAVTGPNAADGIGEQTASCSYTDGGGLTAEASVTYGIVDPSVPTIGYIVTGTLGNDGWYVSDVTLTWTVTEGESPSSLSKTGCNDQSITSDQDEMSYSCSASSAGGSAGPVSVSIKRDATVPSVDCGTADGAWHGSDVSIGCTASDALSGLSESADAAFDLSTSVAADTEADDASTGSRTVYDAAGNATAAGPIGGNMVDKKAPSISCGSTDGLWHASDESIGCTASDGGAGVDPSGDEAFSLSTNVPADTETANALTDTKTVSDAVGNDATAGPIGGSKVDKKAPSISCGAADDLWHASDESIGCTASDGGSGIDPSGDESFSLSTNVPAGAESANALTGTKTVSDAVGNEAIAGPVGGNKVDKRGPAVVLTCPSNVVLGSSASASWAASDGGSGVAAGYESGTMAGLETSTIGMKTAMASPGTSKDDVGNNSPQASCTYYVIYSWHGFFRPVDNPPTPNVAKAGSSIPVKFSLGGHQGMSIFAAGYPKSAVIPCDGTVQPDVLEETATAGSSGLNYDAATDQYTYVWKTDKTWAGTCRRLDVKLNDLTVHSASFKFIK